MEKMLNEGNQIHNFMSCSGSGSVINYGPCSGSDFLTSYSSGSGSGSKSQKVTVPTVPVPVPVPVPQHWPALHSTGFWSICTGYRYGSTFRIWFSCTQAKNVFLVTELLLRK